jgi:drug/metabolite transporter (DMT)-like permease
VRSATRRSVIYGLDGTGAGARPAGSLKKPPMSRIYVPYIAALALLWGASYMFIKVAVRGFEPAAMILLRLVIASVLVLGALVAQRGLARSLADLRRLGWEGFALGVVNGAIPFTLIAWGEKHIDSGVAAIGNASMPIFVVLLAWRWKPSETVRGSRLGGILLGLLGVAVLAGVHPEGGWWGAIGTLAVILSSVSYAAGSLWSQRLVARTSELTLAVASLVGGAIALLPLGLLQMPGRVPGWKETGSVVALAVLGTALAQIIVYRVVRSDGAARVSLVTYLLPVTALFYGVTLLGEPLTLEELVGMVLILAGVALGSGALRWSHRREAAAVPSP